jgi:hypothetical protein
MGGPGNPEEADGPLIERTLTTTPPVIAFKRLLLAL